MIGYSPGNGAYHVEPEAPKYKPKGQGYNFGRAVQGGHEAIRLPSGRWVLAAVVWLPFGGGKQEDMLPGEYDTEAEAEKAARRLIKEAPGALIGRPPSVGKGPGVWKELEGDRDGDQGKSEEETSAGT
jgi:hypothetical protein